MIKQLKSSIMKQVSLLLCLLVLLTCAYAQEARVPRRVTLKVSVMDSIQRVGFGYLAALADSGIVMVKAPIVFDHTLASSNANTINYQNISQVTIKRKGSVGRGILIGALGGMLVGGIAGYISYKPVDCKDAIFCFDFGPGADAAAGASVGLLGGGIIGGIIGALAKKTFIIGGKKNKFDEMKVNVLDMAYRNAK
jgi:hypothetical protein